MNDEINKWRRTNQKPIRPKKDVSVSRQRRCAKSVRNEKLPERFVLEKNNRLEAKRNHLETVVNHSYFGKKRQDKPAYGTIAAIVAIGTTVLRMFGCGNMVNMDGCNGKRQYKYD
jgi:hypothetical protein